MCVVDLEFYYLSAFIIEEKKVGGKEIFLFDDKKIFIYSISV